MDNSLTYKVITRKEQYFQYCDIIDDLLERDDAIHDDDIELLTLLIKTWDDEHNTFTNLSDPIELIKALMMEHELKSKDMIEIMGVSKTMVSLILSKKKGLSKKVIRNVASYFKISQEALNKVYSINRMTDEDSLLVERNEECKIIKIDFLIPDGVDSESIKEKVLKRGQLLQM